MILGWQRAIGPVKPLQVDLRPIRRNYHRCCKVPLRVEEFSN